MPQDSLPYMISSGDTVYIINSTDDIEQLNHKTILPPEVLQQMQKTIEEEELKTQKKNSDTFFFGFAFTLLIVYISAKIIKRKSQADDLYNADVTEENTTANNAYLTYYGSDLNFSNEEIGLACAKYNTYFKNLSSEKRVIFISRVQHFIKNKNFYINAEKGYKEMPILTSAAAIQITFGLSEYLLPAFSNIIIHPQEYFGFNPLRVLEGNVQGDSITLSWKHFLHDYQNPVDGKNVGLHEMAHALQVQYLFNHPNSSNDFKENFEFYDRIDEQILQSAKTNLLFDRNALRNTNELWATSIELFFEKPQELKLHYPDLYNGICTVLKQYPASVM